MESVDLSDYTIIVTGASAGLDKETTYYLVKFNATVIMACRDLKKAKKAKDNILNRFICTKHANYQF